MISLKDFGKNSLSFKESSVIHGGNTYCVSVSPTQYGDVKDKSYEQYGDDGKFQTGWSTLE